MIEKWGEKGEKFVRIADMCDPEKEKKVQIWNRKIFAFNSMRGWFIEFTRKRCGANMQAEKWIWNEEEEKFKSRNEEEERKLLKSFKVLSFRWKTLNLTKKFKFKWDFEF